MIRINQNKILVIGDLMLDQYIIGHVSRISPEAPVPVLLKSEERRVLGGAGNVAANLIAAKQQAVICSVIGDDAAADAIEEDFAKLGVDYSLLLKSQMRTTTVKTRIVGQHNTQITRIDEEVTDYISDKECANLLHMIANLISSVDAVIISDYCKGVLTEQLCQAIIKISNEHGKKVFIDVKDANIDKYKNAYLLKPNKSELKSLTGMAVSTVKEIDAAALLLMKKTGCMNVLTTMGSEGMYLLSSDGQRELIPAVEHEVFDVSGAGDTSVSYLVSGVCSGMSISEAAHFANIAAGIKVTKVRTSPVFLHEVMSEISKDCGRASLNKKVLEPDDLSVFHVLAHGKKIVFTNGCFDILHVGHITYLREAAQLGDLLIVGLNSDASIKRLKGAERPINCQADRAEMLAALECVDYVVIFDDDTPLELIKTVKPDILVKGGDYAVENIVGSDFVSELGGRVVTIPLVEGKSTTKLINCIKQEHQDSAKL